MTICVTPSI